MGWNTFDPNAFTEQGVAMLSGILSSDRAINVNIQIMRIFTRIRQMFVDNTELRLEIEKIKTKLDNQDKNMEIVFRYLDELIDRKEEPQERIRIGYKQDILWGRFVDGTRTLPCYILIFNILQVRKRSNSRITHIKFATV